MRKILLLLLFLSSTILIQAQDSIRISTTPKHELGFDISFLFIRLFNNQNNNLLFFEPTYQVVYNRQFRHFGLRSGLGGSISLEEQTAQAELDDEPQKDTNIRIDFRLGIEKKALTSKRLDIYYGLDYQHRYSKSYKDGSDYLGEFRLGRQTVSNRYGLAPLLGFEFKITERLALRTEAAFSIDATKEHYEEFATIYRNDIGGAEEPELFDRKTTRFNSRFLYPNFIVVNFKF